MCEVKLVSDQPVTEARMMSFFSGPCADYAQVNCYPMTALDLFYGELTYPLRGGLEVICDGWEKPRRFGVWRLMKEDGFRVSTVIEFLSGWYFTTTHRRPGFVFMKNLPRNAESGLQVADLMLFEAEWALDKCVMVGG
jgi:hypothetical protein